MPVLNNIMAGAAGQTGGAADAVATKSLRFNSGDSSYLSKTPSSTGNRKTFTLSFWVKRHRLDGNAQQIFGQYRAGSPEAQNRFQLYFLGTGELEIHTFSLTHLKTSRVFRDSSAWYHIVLAVDTTSSTADNRMRIYVNGAEVTDFATRNNPSQNLDLGVNTDGEINIGTAANAKSSFYGDFSLADIYFVEGSQLDATSFGAFDSNGVWQAAVYSGTYGTNGFHLLDFANEPTIGNDSSGNNNDFTANNLISEDPTPLPGVLFDGSGDYLSFADSSDFDLVSSGTGDFTIEFFIKKTASANMYVLASGTDSTRLYINASSGRIHLNNPTDSILMESSAAYTAYNNATGWVHIAFVKSSSTGYIFVNGTSQAQHGPAFSLGGDLDFNNLTISRDSTGVQGYISNLRIVKGSAVYTSNFATPNAPLSNVTNTKLLCCQSSSSTTAATVTPGTITANGDVAASSVAANSTGANDVLFDVPTNDTTNTDSGAGGEVSGNYCVMNALSKPTGSSFSNGNLQVSNSGGWYSHTGTIGVSSGKWYYEFEKTSGSYTGVGWRNDVTTAGNPSFNANGGGIYLSHNGNKQSSAGSPSYGATWGSGDIIGVAFDRDAGTITYYKNNVSQGQAFTGMTDGTFFPEVQIYQSGGVINFGQRPFVYTAPSGYKALCTTNLPTPTIADGSDYFDIKKYTSNNASLSVTGYEFSPAFVWIKNRDSAQMHGLFDVVRGPNKFLSSNRTNAENTTSGSGYGSGTFNSFDSNGFTLGDDAGQYTTNYPPNEAHIAWAWNGGSSNTSISAGSLNSSFYDSRTLWRNALSGTIYSGQSAATLFNNSAQGIHAASGNSITFTTPSGYALSGTLEVHMARGNGASAAYGTYDVKVNGTSVFDHSKFPNNTNAIVNLGTFNNITSIEWGYGGNNSNDWIQFNDIRVNGKELVDSDVTLPNVPSIASTVRAQPSAGFSVVSFTAGSSGSIAHGLNAKPSVVIFKNRDTAGNWRFYHRDVGTSTILFLNTPAAATSTSERVTASSSSTFTVGGTISGDDYIAYCFAPVAGYSAMGSFVGGSSPFVFTGFRPRFLLVKSSSSTTSNWIILDSERNTFNEMDDILRPDISNEEVADQYSRTDFLSNGFKIQGSGSTYGLNGANVTYIWYAVAENPFQANGGLAR